MSMETTKFVGECVPVVEDEDRGCALIAEIGPNDDEWETTALLVRIHSWDQAGQHAEVERLRGKVVRITIETLDDE